MLAQTRGPDSVLLLLGWLPLASLCPDCSMLRRRGPGPLAIQPHICPRTAGRSVDCPVAGYRSLARPRSLEEHVVHVQNPRSAGENVLALGGVVPLE